MNRSKQEQTLSPTFIQTTARSGSTWLRSLISSNPVVFDKGEFLYPGTFPGGFFSYLYKQQSKQPQVFLPKVGCMDLAMKRYLQVNASRHRARALIYDLKIEQLDMVRLVRNPIYSSNSKFLELSRKNTLKQIISIHLMNARQKSGTAPIHSKQVPAPITLSVNVEQVVSHIEEVRLLQREYSTLLAAFGRPTLKIFYEDLCDPKTLQSNLGLIGDFLGIDLTEAKSELVKQNPMDLEQYVGNFKELSKRLKARRLDFLLALPS